MIDETDSGTRLDRHLSLCLPEFSRSRIQDLIRCHAITINNQGVKPSATLRTHDQIQITLPPDTSTAAPPLAQELPLHILFEDDEIIVVNKASGIVTHPGPGTPDGTLVNALLSHCQGKLSQMGDPERPGIIHRLDKGTSGCLVAAKTNRAHEELARQFANRETRKWYLAIVRGTPYQPNGRIVNQLGRHPVDRKRHSIQKDGSGKFADTEWVRGPTIDQTTLILCRLHTGRTHQIRVHMKEGLHCPILGDELYGKNDAPRLLLHAWRLGFQHPTTGVPWLGEAPFPEEFAPWLQNFNPTSLLQS